MKLTLSICVLILGTLVPSLSRAEPVFQAGDGKTTVVLYNDPCAEPAVTNLPHRATWTEGPKVIEGCWVLAANIGLVVTYFADKTVVLIPAEGFRKVQGV
jgi:hypothetical protein